MAKGTKEKVQEDKKDELQLALDRLNKEYGIGTVISGNEKNTDIKTVSTGSLLVDMQTGVGGLPYSRIVEVYGPESSGKTTLCIHTMANAQKDVQDDRKVALIDMEHSIHPGYMEKLGVNMSELILSQPPYGEAAMEVAYQLINSGRVKVVVVDSVAALVPKSELGGENGLSGDAKMAGLGRLMSQSLRKLTPIVEKHNCLLIFTNQLRDTPGVMYGSPERPTGGNALKFYASMRIDMRKSVDKEHGLNKTTVKIIKSKVSKPFGQCVVEIVWGEGFNRMGEIIDMAEELKVFTKAGSWYDYDGKHLANGYDNMMQFFKDNEEFYMEIEHKCMQLINPDTSTIEK